MVGGDMDTDSDDEDYMETPSSDQQFRTAAHDHEVGASGESMLESILSLTKMMCIMQREMWEFNQDRARKNNTINEMHASILRTQTMMLEQMQEDRVNWHYKFTYLIEHSGLPPSLDRLPTNPILCATPSHQLSQGPIL